MTWLWHWLIRRAGMSDCNGCLYSFGPCKTHDSNMLESA